MMLDPPEPTIVINGVTLSEGQALSVRMAVVMLQAQLQDDDDWGPSWGAMYRARLREVFALMHTPSSAG